MERVVVAKNVHGIWLHLLLLPSPTRPPLNPLTGAILAIRVQRKPNVTSASPTDPVPVTDLLTPTIAHFALISVV